MDEIGFTSINQLISDKYNNVWIGTNDGLFMYNGYRVFNLTSKLKHPRVNLLKRLDTKGVIIADGLFNYYLLDQDYLLQISSINEKQFNTIFKYNKSKDIGFKFDLNQTTFNLSDKILVDYYCIDSNIIISRKFDYFKVKHDYIVNSNYITDLNTEMVSSGLLINSNKNLFTMLENEIFSLHLNNGKIERKLYAKNLPINKHKEKLKIGIYNSYNECFTFGSETLGLIELKKNYFSVAEIDKKTKKYLNGSILYSQCEDPKGNIFVNNIGVFHSNGKFTSFKNNSSFIRSINYLDSKNNVWLVDEKKIKIYNDLKESKILTLDSIDNPIIGITELNDSIKVLISANEIVILENYDKKEYVFKDHLNIMKDENYSYIFTNKINSTCYLLTNKSVYKLDIELKQLEKEKNLKSADYRIMQPLNDKYSFIGTYGQGFLIFDGNKWIKMPQDTKGYLKFAHAALVDDNGHIWISTNNGLFRTQFKNVISYIEGKTNEIFYYYYDKSSGFLTNEFNGGCQSPALKLKDGRFSFSSMDGLVQFDPLIVPISFPTNPIHLIHLFLNHQKQDTIPKVLIIDQSIKDLKFEFSTAYFGHENNIVMEYMLDRLDQNWKPLDQKSIVNLQNVPHGQYTLKVRKREGFENDAFSYFEFPIEIVPYFYQTWWFRVILCVIGLTLAYIFSRWYSRYMIQKNKELEMLIIERNKEVLQTNEVLQEQVKQNDLFQSIFVHDVKSPIRFITSNTALLKTHWNHLDTTIKQDQITHIHDAATKIDHFIEETLLWIKIRNGELQLETNDFQALAMIQKCIDFHKTSDKIIRGDIQILADVRQDLFLTQDERLLATIVRNLISNSIKYTARGKIIVYFLSNPNGSFTIGCQDTGKGMPKSLVEKLLSDHYRGNDIRDDSFKMGYVIIKEIVRLIGGQLHIESEENHGTDVCVVF
jgi:signal transduction histidine kinase